MKLTKEIKTAYAMALVLASDAAMAAAQGGLDANPHDKLQKILDIIQDCGVVVLTIAVCWAGYKIMFQGQTLREVAPPLLGAILFAGAGYLANLLI
ncbi:MAG: TrbC/VirB2 family protein [Succinivibrionaceae bacterium]|nr:TrbC/VirB2 family protein [Succinivibrionaceae bacterium]